MQNSAPADDKIYFLIDQPESAGQIMANTLLARDVYRNIASFVGDALDFAKQARNSADPMHHRYHNTVLIDGARGTGKSTVLINLGRYLASCNAETFEQVHICAPVDPTLLEDHDDLFLNVILAAVLSDKKVEEAQQRNPSGRQALAKQLQKLGAALEHMQNQREHTQKGMDKLRAFVGNQQLIQEVHDFFAEVLKLLDKRLLILTIDDVDTGLDKAFENLEVVRRYLTSPYVMPIISGDLSLYHEVIWRNFLGRLLEKSKEESAASVETAKELAREYERKVLPMQYRQKMPEVKDYFKNKDIYFARMGQGEIEPIVSMPVFYAWLNALLNGPVNGLEQGFVDVPIPTTRALAQLVRKTKFLFSGLQQQMHEFADSRSWSGSWEVLSQAMTEKIFLRKDDALKDLAAKWLGELRSYFGHEGSSCASFLLAETFFFWLSDDFAHADSPLNSPLFMPAQHGKIQGFKLDVKNEWQAELERYLPKSKLRFFPQYTGLFFPRPQVGAPISGSSMKAIRHLASVDPMQSLCCDMVLHREYYTSGNMAWQRYMGRVFELVVLGLLRDVSERDISRLLQKSPFYSTTSYAGSSGYYEDDGEEDNFPSEVNQEANGAVWSEQQSEVRNQLVHDINQWRKLVLGSGLRLSPWLVFNAMQRCFSLNFPRQLGFRGGNPPSINPGGVFRSFGMAFFNVWSAFAYLETGSLFGRSDAVSTGQLRWRSISKEIDYKRTDMYQQNILGLLMANEKNHKPSVTCLLSLHPLCELALSSFRAMAEIEDDDWGDNWGDDEDNLTKNKNVNFNGGGGNKTYSSLTKKSSPIREEAVLREGLSSREWMRKHVLVADEFLRFKGKIEAIHIAHALRVSFSDFENANQLFNEFVTKYNKKSELAPRFREAIEAVYGRSPEPLDKPAE